MLLKLFQLIDRWLHRRELSQLTPWQRVICLSVNQPHRVDEWPEPRRFIVTFVKDDDKR